MSCDSHEELEYVKFMPRILTDEQHSKPRCMASNLLKWKMEDINFFRVTFSVPELKNALVERLLA